MGKYDEEKAIAVTTLLLKLSGGVSDKYWLNKVLYYVERQSLLESGEPLFNDRLCSIKYGPIVSKTNDCIDLATGILSTEWDKYIHTAETKVELISDGRYELLSPFEEKLINKAYVKFKGWGFGKLKEYFHGLPEYKQTNSSIPINYSEILTKNGFTPEQIKEVISELEYSEFVEDILNK